MKNIERVKNIFQSSIYGQVVIALLVLSFFLFLAIGFIFRSVSEDYLGEVIAHYGNNVSSIVEGALYHSMLTNNRSELKNTLDVLNNLQRIEDVNMYDSNDNLVYSAYNQTNEEHDNPNCIECHNNLRTLFSETEPTFRIANLDSECTMSSSTYSERLLIVRSPIRNEPSCYTAACHAHSEEEKILGSVIIRVPLRDLDNNIATSTRNFFVLASITTILLVILLLLFTRQKVRNPLGEIVRASKAVSGGDISMRVNLEKTQLRDMQQVSEAFNEMLDNLQNANRELENWSQQLEYKVQKKSEEISSMQNELIHVERIASLGKLSSSVAHEINNPLSGVLTYTKLVHKQLDKAELDEQVKEPMLRHLSVIEEETKRCGDIVKGLLEFSRKDQHDFKSIRLHKVLKEAFMLMDHQMEMEGINFISDFSAGTDTIRGNENQIKQACIAILLNSTESISDNGEIVLRTRNPNSEQIIVEISDNGSGINPDDLSHIFEPFFSGKSKASGIGLGLAIVHGIVQSHNGKIEVHSELQKGTTLTLLFPLENHRGESLVNHT